MDEHLELGHLSCTGHQDASLLPHPPPAAGAGYLASPGVPLGFHSWETAQLLAMHPARSIPPGTPRCSGLHFQSWSLPCLVVRLLSKDFAGDAGEGGKIHPTPS